MQTDRTVVQQLVVNVRVDTGLKHFYFETQNLICEAQFMGERHGSRNHISRTGSSSDQGELTVREDRTGLIPVAGFISHADTTGTYR